VAINYWSVNIRRWRALYELMILYVFGRNVVE
jgi:hypothetical protein